MSRTGTRPRPAPYLSVAVFPPQGDVDIQSAYIAKAIQYRPQRMI
jgi:hypothetical protein